MILLSLLLFIILLLLAFLHFYWVLGGQWGFAAAVPTKENGERVLHPGKVDSAIVGLGLSAFGFFYLFLSELVSIRLPDWVFDYGGWIIPAIFLLRAMGDFKYIGFFKKVKSTRFGRLDTKYFSPLCLGIGIVGLIVQMLQ
jgi:hypothetical protein